MYFETDGTIVWASPATRTVFGADPAALVGRNGLEMVHVDDRERVLTEFAGIDTPGDHVSVEFRVTADDGTLRWIEETATNLVDDPQVGYIVGNLRDITARKQAEDAIELQSKILDAAGQAIVLTDIGGGITYWNAAATAIYGWDIDEVLGHAAARVLRPADGWDSDTKAAIACIEAGEEWSGDLRVRRKDGVEIPVLVTYTPVFSDSGVRIGAVGVASDISERKQHELDHARLSTIVASSGDAILSTTLTGIVESWNRAAEDLYGYSAERIIGKNMAITVPPGLTGQWHANIDAVRSGRSVSGLDTVRRRADGTDVHVSISASPIRDTTGEVVGASAIVRDITDRKRLELDLLRQATHDALTGLPNRRLLLEQLHTMLRTRRTGEGDVGVALFDVDRFKVINDSLGHERGDELLVAMAELLRNVAGDEDIVSRFGSDTFVLVMPAIASSGALVDLVERMRAGLAEGLGAGGERYTLTVSAGLVIAHPGDVASDVLRDADTAMYRAKERGRNRSEWFDLSLHHEIVANFAVERELQLAIERDELRMVFQPVLDLETDEIFLCEALVRWDHPDRGPVSPDEFIPVAESSGLIVELGAWVLRATLATVAGWPEAMHVAVNISPRQLAEPDLVGLVRDTLDEYRIAAARLVLEVTETAVVQDPTAAARTISSLRALGVRVVIDDFGTGYTSLSFLRDYPLDGLKIDRSFVADLDGGSIAIVDAIIRMSGALGLHVVAEGVETETQLSTLRHLGCQYVQGFLVSRPVPSRDLPFMRRRCTGPSATPTFSLRAVCPNTIQ
jgi:diguanylate cyclase (GGDEF)-like protein/PAS domain S-box-containing protein